MAMRKFILGLFLLTVALGTFVGAGVQLFYQKESLGVLTQSIESQLIQNRFNFRSLSILKSQHITSAEIHYLGSSSSHPITQSHQPSFLLKIKNLLSHSPSKGDYIIFTIDLLPSIIHSAGFSIAIFSLLAPFFVFYFKKEKLKTLKSIRSDLSRRRILKYRQLMHDLKNPIAIFEAINSKSVADEDQQGELFKMAILRTKEIVSEFCKLKNHNNYMNDTPSSLQDISSVIDEFKYIAPHINFSFEGDVGPNRLPSFQTKRILSNLIANSVEAIDLRQKGSIKILIEKSNQHCFIKVSDNGKGLPQSIVERLNSSPFSYNKENGNGLGLKHAHSALKEIGGKLTIESTLGFGTTVTLMIPLIQDEVSVVHLDDDQYIRKLWEVTAQEKKIPLMSLRSFEELKNIFPTLSKDTQFYIDQNLESESVLGTDILQWLYQNGSRELTLTTGETLPSTANYRVIDKNPPWIQNIIK
jgi:hypothetical protein